MSTLVLFTLLGLMGPPQDFVGKIPTSPSPQSGQFPIGMNQFTHIQRFSADQQQALANRDTCYTMRTYVFRRQDGTAPVLVGTTTCTPANVVRRQQVNHPPEVRLVPAN
jgi:hypothetical protein